LHREDIAEIAVKAIDLDMGAREPVNQLGRDAHAPAGLAHRSFQHITPLRSRLTRFTLDRPAN
jgi:hypothetical protein